MSDSLPCLLLSLMGGRVSPPCPPSFPPPLSPPFHLCSTCWTARSNWPTLCWLLASRSSLTGSPESGMEMGLPKRLERAVRCGDGYGDSMLGPRSLTGGFIAPYDTLGRLTGIFRAPSFSGSAAMDILLRWFTCHGCSPSLLLRPWTLSQGRVRWRCVRAVRGSCGDPQASQPPLLPFQEAYPHHRSDKAQTPPAAYRVPTGFAYSVPAVCLQCAFGVPTGCQQCPCSVPAVCLLGANTGLVMWAYPKN